MLIATFAIPPEALALERAFREVPAMAIEAERIAAHSREWVMPCLWVANADFSDVDDAFEVDPSVDEVVETRGFGQEKYYQVEWSEPVKRRIDRFVDEEGAILEASATADAWRVQTRFASRDQFEAFREYFRNADHSFELIDLTEPEMPRQSFGGLTAEQREAVITALEHGYFQVPRESSSQELAEKLGISHQSVSERLRRGMETLARSTLVTEEELGDERD